MKSFRASLLTLYISTTAVLEVNPLLYLYSFTLTNFRRFYRRKFFYPIRHYYDMTGGEVRNWKVCGLILLVAIVAVWVLLIMYQPLLAEWRSTGWRYNHCSDYIQADIGTCWIIFSRSMYKATRQGMPKHDVITSYI